MTARQVLSGWGGTAPSAADVARPADSSGVAALLGEAAAAGTLVAPRGLGRSYGDAAQCGGGTVLDLGGLDTVHDADLGTGTVRVGAGTSLDSLMRAFVPRGWFVPVTPGTRQVTVGGAVAADIHGKNHHRDGSLCSHVRAMTLVTPTDTHALSPETSPDAFWATAGGMGLTGVVTEATLQMTPIESAYMVVDTERAADVDDCMAAMTEGDDRYRYSVAWIDCLATGSRLGRSVLTRADHATIGDLGAAERRQPLAFAPRSGPHVPVNAPPGLLNPLTVAAFNELWFRKAPRRRLGQLQPLWAYFHPLDGVGAWNRLYGRRGFVQYQFVVPAAGADTVRRVLERLATARVASFLAVLKRFGPGDPGPLSFPMAGWTLALDIPVAGGDLSLLLDEIDEEVAQGGGRVYLAKDARLRPELVPVMYPRLAEWRAARDELDPAGVLSTDLGRRLGLVGRRQPPRRRRAKRPTTARSRRPRTEART